MVLGPEGKFQILFVCTGNICRSPAAAALLKKKMDPSLADRVSIMSAGTHAAEGLPVSRNSAGVSHQFGVDLSGHTSQPLTAELVAQSDLILAMESAHIEFIGRLDPASHPRTFLLGQFGRGDAAGLDGDSKIDDPIVGNQDTYLRVYGEIEAEITRIIGIIEDMVHGATK